MKKQSIEDLENIIASMKSAQTEHPKATVYYYWQDNEIRITYPIPKDMQGIVGSTAWKKLCTCHVWDIHGYCEHTASDRERRDEKCTCKKLSPPYVHFRDCPTVTKK